MSQNKLRTSVADYIDVVSKLLIHASDAIKEGNGQEVAEGLIVLSKEIKTSAHNIKYGISSEDA